MHYFFYKYFVILIASVGHTIAVLDILIVQVNMSTGYMSRRNSMPFKNIIYVSPNQTDTCPLIIDQSSTITHYDNLDLLIKGFDSANTTDLIIIDVPLLFKEHKSAIFDSLDLLSTVLNCLYKCNVITPIPYVAILDDSLSVKVIETLVGLKYINGFFPASGTLEGKQLAESEIANGMCHLPDSIVKKIQPTNTKVKDEITLTPRQQEILSIIKQRGASNKVIARMLGITESTVKLHITAILKKHKVRNRTQLALFSM